MADNSYMLMWLAISSALALAPDVAPWSTSAGAPRPVDAGRADLHELAASNYLAPVDLRVPNRFESVFRYQDVGHMGERWNMADADAKSGQSGFVRFSGGVAAVFPFSSYRSTPAGKLAEIPAGTVYRLDLRPPSPSDRVYAPPPAPSYNQVSAEAASAPRDLAVARKPTHAGPVAADVPAKTDETHGLWNDETYRARVIGDLLDRAVR